eukprot:751846-Hanusia_phi.AAC.4
MQLDDARVSRRSLRPRRLGHSVHELHCPGDGVSSSQLLPLVDGVLVGRIVGDLRRLRVDDLARHGPCADAGVSRCRDLDSSSHCRHLQVARGRSPQDRLDVFLQELVSVPPAAAQEVGPPTPCSEEDGVVLHEHGLLGLRCSQILPLHLDHRCVLQRHEEEVSSGEDNIAVVLLHVPMP